MKAFDLPPALMFDEGFEQPIFGANYWKGKCKPLTPGSLPGDPSFKMWLMEGGCMRFIKSIRFCLKRLRQASKERNPHFDLAAEVASAAFQQDFALFDPNDPSTIYVNQPPIHGPMPVQPGFGGPQQGPPPGGYGMQPPPNQGPPPG